MFFDNAPCAPWNYSSDQDIGRALERSLPEIATRKEVSILTGGFFKPKTLSNMDAKNQGHARKIMIGKYVGYFKSDFIEFFMRQIKQI